MSHITYPESIVIGLLQGVTELFPVSSLGHSILAPALVGGAWKRDLSMGEGSPYLAVLVAMHVATALALVAFFWRDWIRVIGGLASSLRHRRISTPYERLGVLLVVATIPVGLAGLALDSAMRHWLGRPVPAAIFLALNGVVLLGVDRLRGNGSGRHAAGRAASAAATNVAPAGAAVADPGTTQRVGYGPGADTAHTTGGAMDESAAGAASDERLSRLGLVRGTMIGAAQVLALFPGISRSGITMAAGLLRGLSHEDAARFSFLLATPVILAAGVFKLPELMGSAGDGVRGQALAGSLVAGVAAYISVRFLTRYFETRTLTPFAIYCMVAGVGSAVYFAMS